MVSLIFEDTRELSDFIAGEIVKAVAQNPKIVLGLATGRTFVPIYESIVRKASEEKISFSNVTTFNLDEYVGLAAGEECSFQRYMERNLWSRLDFDRQKTHIPDGTAKDPKAECAAYEEKIRRAGGIDIQLLGLGLNGHIGFNEPGSSFDSVTRVVSLSETTKLQNAADFKNAKVPDHAMTMGISTILKAKKCYLVVLGKDKAEILAKSLQATDHDIPSTALLCHGNCTVVMDKPAARLIAA